MTTLVATNTAWRLSTFPTRLGWAALLTSDERVARLTFGHADPATALTDFLPADVAGLMQEATRRDAFAREIVRRLQAWAEGERDEFRDVALALAPRGEFARRVVAACRRIPYGETVTYQELARRAGSPAAARAVGNTMARNPTPIIVPCHRVLAAGGGLGGYSGPNGVALKTRLLAMESTAAGPPKWAAGGRKPG